MLHNSPVLTLEETEPVTFDSKFHDGEPKRGKQIYTFMFNLLMDFESRKFEYIITDPL